MFVDYETRILVPSFYLDKCESSITSFSKLNETKHLIKRYAVENAPKFLIIED